MDYLTISDLLHLLKNNKDRGITFFSGETEEKSISFFDLYNRALIFLGILQKKGVQSGDELVFQLEENEAFIVVFWACLLGGIIPVPVTVGKKSEHRLKLFRIWKKLNNPFLITDQKSMEDIKKFGDKNDLEETGTILSRALLYESVPAGPEGKIFPAGADDICFIQFSSGSTGDPKGVILTNANLISNIEAIKKRALITAEDRMLSFLPLTHDMGLILVHLTGLLAGCDQYLMANSLFVKNPLLWMEKTDTFRATLLFSPNFGLKYFLNFYQNHDKKWDLSSVRLLFNGGEPISYEVCRSFLTVLAGNNLKESVIYPGYGIAEASVSASIAENTSQGTKPVYLNRNRLNIGQMAVEEKNSAVFIDVGTVVDDCSIRICGPGNSPLPENYIGHIQLKGKNVSPGYYNDTEATRQAFTPDNWLKTGDIGFLRNNHLVITGRARDVLIVNGQNYFANDLEQVLQTNREFKKLHVAAAGIYNHEQQQEEVVFFIRHSKRKLAEFSHLAGLLKKIIYNETGIMVDSVVPVRRIERTTSGKIQRYLLAEDYKNGKYDRILEELAEIERQHNLIDDDAKQIRLEPLPVEPVQKETYEAELLLRFRVLTGIETLQCDDVLLDLPLSSIKFLSVIKELKKEFIIEISDLITYPTIKELAQNIIISN